MSALTYDIDRFQKLAVMGIPCSTRPIEGFAARLHSLYKLGFEYVYFGDELFSHVRAGADLPLIKKAVANSGMKVHSAHFGYLYPGPGDSLARLKSHHLRDLDTAAEIGVKYVTTHYLSITGMGEPGFLSPGVLETFSSNWIKGVGALFEEAMANLGGRDAFLEKNNELYRWLCDEASQRGITVTIETATCHLTKTPSMIVDLIRAIDRPNLGICLDSGHSHIMMGDVADAVRQAGSFLMETHFHDNFGDYDWHRPVGIGTINWPEVILALQEISFAGPVTFETGGQYHNTDIEEMKIYARNWKEFLNTTALRQARNPG